LELKGTYKRRYKMRVQGENGLNTVVSIPRPVIEREAEMHGMTPEEFIKRFRAVAHYDSFEGVHYTFEEAND